ncbi:MAG TPA: 16S rRNA (cytidine(1402)-2'-O)-methyltransferase [Gammaproteobacteria bacterium]|nr:16S rRNA (cytidine(1402)-2'-O)-methyltransferase [Gammaproteobacteria bacterium]
MSINTKTHRPGCLYVVATPIGNLEDVSGRALRILREVQFILAEDTRVSARLLAHYGITTPLRAFYDHNERATTAGWLERLRDGAQIALISDAGTPLINDPGFLLVREALTHGVRVMAVPGPSAVIAGLSVAGVPVDRFTYEGFLPATAVARQGRLRALAGEQRTMVFLEAPHRLRATLADLRVIFGSARRLTLARELTKKHETLLHGTVDEVSARVESEPEQNLGEMVLCVEGAPEDRAERERAMTVMHVLAKYLPPGRAASAASALTGVPRQELYAQFMKTHAGTKAEMP